MNNALANTSSQTDRSLATWISKVESKSALAPGTGAVLCIELSDRSRDGGELTPERLCSIWMKLTQDFGGLLGFGFLDDHRGLIVAPDERAWVSIAAVAVEAAVALGMRGHDLSVGVGLAEFEAPGQRIEDVIRLSAAAARDASLGGIGFARRTLAHEDREQRAATLRHSLKSALDGDIQGLRVIFQPKVHAMTGKIVGAEALLRFRCPALGDVSAIELLSVAEAAGELGRIDRWVLGLVAQCQASFVADGLDPLPISVNVRGATAFAPGFTEFLGSLLSTFGVDPHLVEIELREGEVQKNIALSEHVISSLRAIGVAVALDDFGRRRTTFADLNRLRVTSVKLDRSIVREMMTDAGVEKLVHGMLHLARVLGVQTVAVGIENEGQAAGLRIAGCETLQGFLFHQPLEAIDFVRCVQESRGLVLSR